MNAKESKDALKEILSEILNEDGTASFNSFSGLRNVDAKVREAKLILKETPGRIGSLVDDMEKDEGFTANSRRVRLETLADYCRTAIKFIDKGVLDKKKKKIYRAPDVSILTSIMPNLENSIKNRWLDAQKCQHVKCYLSAVIMMGSILEALLLARASMNPSEVYQAKHAPKQKNGKNIALQDWNLSSLINVAVELDWLKSDRGKFSHALRESRNVVHPYVEVSLKANFYEATCKTCWNVLNASVDDLLASM